MCREYLRETERNSARNIIEDIRVMISVFFGSTNLLNKIGKRILRFTAALPRTPRRRRNDQYWVRQMFLRRRVNYRLRSSVRNSSCRR